MANNNALYDATVAGAGGAAQRGWLIATNAGAYVTFAADVNTLAVAIDLQIAPIVGGPSISQINLLQSITEAVLSARYPIANAPATYVDISRAIATLFNALSPLLTNNPTIITNILAGSGITVSIVNGVATITGLGPRWQTIFDLDLATLPTSWSNANGVYAMGGFNWVKYGTVRQRGGGVGNFFGIENGVGFRTQTDAATQPIFQSIINRPYLLLPLSTVIPTFSRYTPVRISSISTLGGDATNNVTHYAGFSIQEDAAPYRINWTQQQAMNLTPAIALSYSSYGYSTAGTAYGVNAGTSVEYLNRRILRTTMPDGVGAMFAVHEIASGVVWPVVESDWRWTGTTNVFATAGGPAAVPLAGLLQNMYAEFGAASPGNVNPGPWFSRLKLEAMY
jgi:hypothetical protein